MSFVVYRPKEGERYDQGPVCGDCLELDEEDFREALRRHAEQLIGQAQQLELDANGGGSGRDERLGAGGAITKLASANRLINSHGYHRPRRGSPPTFEGDEWPCSSWVLRGDVIEVRTCKGFTDGAEVRLKRFTSEPDDFH